MKKNKYQAGIQTTEHLSFEEATGFKYNEHLKVYFNKNHSGLSDFSNFMNAEERWFEEESELYEIAEQSDMPHWTVVSFYRENGYDGMYTRTGDEALTRKCNNWVNYGRDGYLFIVFAKTEEELNLFLDMIEQYISYGFSELYIKEVYDDEDYEIIDGMLILTDHDMPRAIEHFKREYLLSDEDFENLYY